MGSPGVVTGLNTPKVAYLHVDTCTSRSNPHLKSVMYKKTERGKGCCISV